MCNCGSEGGKGGDFMRVHKVDGDALQECDG